MHRQDRGDSPADLQARIAFDLLRLARAVWAKASTQYVIKTVTIKKTPPQMRSLLTKRVAIAAASRECGLNVPAAIPVNASALTGARLSATVEGDNVNEPITAPLRSLQIALAM